MHSRPRIESDGSVRHYVLEETHDGDVSAGSCNSPDHCRGANVADENRRQRSVGFQETTRKQAGSRVPWASNVQTRHSFDTLQLQDFPAGFSTGDPYARPSTSVPFGGPRRGCPVSPESYVLVPLVTITPQRSAIDSSIRSMWVAVEVSTHISRPAVSRSLSDQDCLGRHRLELLPTQGSELGKFSNR
jgi:hypothetical protein